jgi:energy-coupling factor transporter ATP-binding protein EcfA2
MIPEKYLSDLTDQLNSHALDVCTRLLPGGRVKGNSYHCDDINGGKGDSFQVVLTGPKVGVFLDRAHPDDKGNLLTLWEKTQGHGFVEAVKEAAEFVGMGAPVEDGDTYVPSNPRKITFKAPRATATNRPDLAPGDDDDDDPMPLAKHSRDETPPSVVAVDWDACLAAFTPEKARELADWRGYSIQFVNWLHEQEMVGIYKGGFAFPVHDASGKVVRIHYRYGEKGWAYHPKGGGDSGPLIIGTAPQHATNVLLFESQWDAFAILDALEADNADNEGVYCAYITRGASSNTDASKLKVAKLIVCPQNDSREKENKTTGRTPAEDWLFKIQSTKSKTTSIAVFVTPQEFEDANDWTRAKKTSRNEMFDLVITGAKNPLLKDVSSTDEILSVNIHDDPDAVIGFEKRFLGKGGSMLLVGPSGIGKSTLTASIVIHAAAGKPWNGITFRKPQKVLVIQAENDKGDLAEMVSGALTAAGFDRDTEALARKNLDWVQENSRTGTEFAKWLEEIIRETGADIVLIDPLLSYVGDDISQQKVASAFLRNGLQPILKRTGIIMMVVHHTGKPSKDPNAFKGWSDSDFSYLGLGSSDITNWARAIAVFAPWGVNTGVCRFLITKRGKRAGMVDESTFEVATSIYLKHSERGLGWVQCERPAEIVAAPRGSGRAPSVTPDDVLKELGDGSNSTRKDILLSILSLAHQTSTRTVKDRVDALMTLDRIHVASTEPRPGGGKDYEWVRIGPKPIRNNQMETTK